MQRLCMEARAIAGAYHIGVERVRLRLLPIMFEFELRVDALRHFIRNVSFTVRNLRGIMDKNLV